MTTKLAFFGAILALGLAGPAVADLGDVIIPQPAQDGGVDSTYTSGPAAAQQTVPGVSAAAGVSAQTLQETDGNTAQGIPASWSPNFITGADSSDMTLTFYNVQPLTDAAWHYSDYGGFDPIDKLQIAFVVQVFDVRTGSADKSFVVFPFTGVAYLVPGGVSASNALSVFGGLNESYMGRTLQATQSNDSNQSAFFGATANGVDDDALNPPSTTSNDGTVFNEAPPDNSGATLISIPGFYPMGRLGQSQDKNFTLSMDIGPVPALKEVVVDSYAIGSETDYPTATIAPYTQHQGAARSVQEIFPNKSGTSQTGNYSRSTVSYYYVFSPTSGAASGYSVPTATVNDTTAAALKTSDPVDNPYVATPAQTVQGISAAAPWTPPAGAASPVSIDAETGMVPLATAGNYTTGTPVDCSGVSFSVPAMYVGDWLQLNGTGVDHNGNGVVCQLQAAAVSMMSGYAMTGATLAKYFTGQPGAVSVKMTSASASSVVNGTAFTPTLSWASTVTGGSSTAKLCYLTVSGTSGTSGPYPANGSVVLPARTAPKNPITGAPEKTVFPAELDCTSNAGNSQALWSLELDPTTGYMACSTTSVGTPTATTPGSPNC